MKIETFVVDAFTKTVFHGNPAAVCILPRWLDDGTLQNIAAENNLSETAFVVNQGGGAYDLRWFTPRVEIDLCGHATLASAFVLTTYYDSHSQEVRFSTKSGELIVEKKDDLLVMDFPSRKPVRIDCIDLLGKALGSIPREVYKSRDLLALFDTETQIREMKPHFELLNQVEEGLGVIVTARGDRVDFVSRFFAPKAGILEDPVTGSSHCTLIPFWSERLQKRALCAHQLSSRFGELFCEDRGERVRIGGHAVLFSRGEFFLSQ